MSPRREFWVHLVLAVLMVGVLYHEVANGGGLPGDRRSPEPFAADRDHTVFEELPSGTPRVAREGKGGGNGSGANGSTSALPTRWCGDAADARRGVEHVGPADGEPNIKVIYARAADARDRLPERAHTIQQLVAQMAWTVAVESNGKKTVRFDLGTRCSLAHADIAEFRLPEAGDDYGHGDEAFDRVVEDLKEVVPASVDGAPRNYLVFLEGVRSSNGATGVASHIHDDRPGSENVVNNGGNFAVVFDGSETKGRWKGAEPWSLRTALHELWHTLGAVQDSSPTAAGNHAGSNRFDRWRTHGNGGGGYGHCDVGRGYDLMCYSERARSEGAPGCESLPDYELALPLASHRERLDCTRDSYFNPERPKSGSYLAANWNTYDAAFLGACRSPELVASCGPVPAVLRRPTPAPRFIRPSVALLKVGWPSLRNPSPVLARSVARSRAAQRMLLDPEARVSVTYPSRTAARFTFVPSTRQRQRMATLNHGRYTVDFCLRFATRRAGAVPRVPSRSAYSHCTYWSTDHPAAIDVPLLVAPGGSSFGGGARKVAVPDEEDAGRPWVIPYLMDAALPGEDRRVLREALRLPLP